MTGVLFLCNGKFRWNRRLHKKSPTGQDSEAAERQIPLKRPAAGGESRKQDFFYKQKGKEGLCFICEVIMNLVFCYQLIYNKNVF